MAFTTFRVLAEEVEHGILSFYKPLYEKGREGRLAKTRWPPYPENLRVMTRTHEGCNLLPAKSPVAAAVHVFLLVIVQVVFETGRR